MRSLVIDDEADARARLIRLLGAHPEVVVIGEAQDGLEAIEKIEELRPDLLFLDIEMPGLKGFEVLRSIPSAIEIPLVIFTTGYDRHALAAFEAILSLADHSNFGMSAEQPDQPRASICLIVDDQAPHHAVAPLSRGNRIVTRVPPACRTSIVIRPWS